MKRNSGMILTKPTEMNEIYHQLVPHPRDEMIHEPYSLKNEYGVIRVLHGS